ncbi:hypothetical protein XAB3213_4140059 [Xanthomonas citri pv. bilvae]|nr:hypothetical protein XAB3213_4140059 [Xanthomonas citri pv. bilvae]
MFVRSLNRCFEKGSAFGARGEFSGTRQRLAPVPGMLDFSSDHGSAIRVVRRHGEDAPPSMYIGRCNR